ncbi:hypothetical protein GJR96_07235 [Haloferax sp. MBLA0076]|uniref:DUF1102 domain-containing protein n=1 Tax=Haloferax litoreum TaxID=2666140 RepID=A0A6A8GF21_9EURY|nr:MULTISPECIES: hypothetical protein [Haloferax]KAB1193249.1 hypothetical protein Hfx1148_07230 [Haloferax sp. CBA1148]MRX21748.1 hypothetical protein [Haloferax litoreum]
MPTRRQTLFAMGNLFVLGGIAGSGASVVVSSSAGASFRVVDTTDGDIELTPANDPPVHVQTDADGYVSALTPGGDDGGLNTRAVTRFEDIVQITNVGTEDIVGIYFSFDATSDTLSAATLDAIEATLQATAASDTLDSSGLSGDNLLAVSPSPSVADGVLEPGEAVPFGLRVDLTPTGRGETLEALPPSDDYDVTVRVHTEWPDQ